MFIFVEGIDGSGKSTLVEELRSSYSTIIPKRPDNKIFFNLDAAKSNEIYVCDRSPLSDMVYRIYDGERPCCNINDLLNILKYTKIVYCVNDRSFENSIKRGEDNITTKEASNKINGIYDMIMKLLKIYNVCDIYQYDYDIDSPSMVINFIENNNMEV